MHAWHVLDFIVGHVTLIFLSSVCSVPSISLDQDSYAAMENATLSITILRSGDLTLPVAVYLTIAPISADNAAQGK